MENLISKLNFYKLIPYLVDRGIPTLPSLQQTFPGDSNRVQTKGGNAHARARTVHWQGGYTATLRVNSTLPVPARAQLRTFFLTFGGTGSAPDKCICPLGKVLTYKNFIYLLNFPIAIVLLRLVLSC